MKSIKLFLFVMLLAGTSAVIAGTAWGAEDVISKVELIAGSNYCHLRFPAIREETLYWPRPELKAASGWDIIDFYGPCDYDPRGKAEQFRCLNEMQVLKGDE